MKVRGHTLDAMERRMDQVTKRYGQHVPLHEFTLTLKPGLVATGGASH